MHRQADALGTSRILTVDTALYRRIGVMQYAHSLPLADREVVITFDDGPLPPYSIQALDTLASECVRVTYFLVGSMARAYPSVVRRIVEDGHTIGTHSENHPSPFSHLPIDRLRGEIDKGIADVAAAAGTPEALAPFFRIPGLDRSELVEHEVAERSLTLFSADTVADDWHRNIRSSDIVALSVRRLEQLGKGILLLHDIHQKTVAALPALFKELKDRGFRIVHVVPSPSDRIAMANKTRLLASAMAEQAMVSDSIDDAGPAIWPTATGAERADDVMLPAPDAAAFHPDDAVCRSTACRCAGRTNRCTCHRRAARFARTATRSLRPRTPMPRIHRVVHRPVPLPGVGTTPMSWTRIPRAQAGDMPRANAAGVTAPTTARATPV